MHLGISATAKSFCPSCKSQRQQANEGGEYTVLLYCITNHIAAHTLFSAVHLLLCGIGDGLHGYELIRCISFGILFHFSRSTCISCISFHSSHYCLHLLPSIQHPLYSSFSPVTAADRSLLVLFQFPLKPSMPTCTTVPSALHLK